MAVYNDLSWSSNTTEPPNNTQVRFNNADYTLVTKLWIDILTNDGYDIYYRLSLIQPGAFVYLQDKNDHTKVVQYQTTGAPVAKTDYFEIPVAFQARATTLSNNQNVAFVIVQPEEETPPTPPTSPLTLDAVKRHLQIPITDTDPDGDQDLTAKLAQAEAIVLDYLKVTVRPDSPIVDAAVLLQVGELWRFRGDDVDGESAPTTAGDLHPTITNLLRRLRGPAFA